MIVTQSCAYPCSRMEKKKLNEVTCPGIVHAILHGFFCAGSTANGFAILVNYGQPRQSKYRILYPVVNRKYSFRCLGLARSRARGGETKLQNQQTKTLKKKKKKKGENRTKQNAAAKLIPH